MNDNFGFFKCLWMLTIFYTALAKEYIVDIPNQGKIGGVELSKSRIQKIVGYYGIPYAKPPIVALRFAPPVTNPLPSWDDVKRDTDYQPSCLQTLADYKNNSELPFLELLSDVQIPGNISEDCLYLNVFVPIGASPPQGFATIIWFHPGNFTTGLPYIWNPHTLVFRQKVIVVTFAWRLNIMGFFTTMDGEASGNYGLMDQQAALQWVKRNIKLFGGNPDNISAMGYGTGAISIGIHMINLESRSLFNKAIIMSGSLFESSAIRYVEEDKPVVDRLAKDFGCIRTPTSLFIDCLRRVDGLLLVKQTSKINWRPLIDKDLSNNSAPFLPESPQKVFEQGDYAKIPIFTGYTNMEQALELDNFENITYSSESLKELFKELISGDIPNVNDTDSACFYNYDHIIDSVMFFYAPTTPKYDAKTFRNITISFMLERTYAASTILLASHLSEDQPTFVYRFDMKPISGPVAKVLPSWVSVPHLFDLLYIWGVPYWRQEPAWDIRDKRISETVMSFWTNFAKFSDPTPTHGLATKWDRYTREKPGILIIDNNIHMSNPDDVNYKAFEFWNDFYPKVVALSTQCCGPSDSSASNKINLFLLLIAFYIHVFNKM